MLAYRLHTHTASLPLELVSRFAFWITVLWWPVTLGLLIFKQSFLLFPQHVFGLEVALTFVPLILSYFSQNLTHSGNVWQWWQSILLAVFTDVPTALAQLYFVLWQTYVLRADLLASAIAFAITMIAAAVRASAIVTLINAERTVAFRAAK
eukprot:TRINITY_DN15199_c0_g1_i1.p1 TRINITY_DN15199_c0_g1~~TRINITY_DN15199_c0_g1_i1.p1  ORF type:complete len:151 (+),score=20.89 TRINITY_DN15199_c0_g1_i1:191-643(+)